MSHTVSQELKRFNYLLGETSMVYHEINRKLGLSDSTSSILYALLEEGGSRLLKDICRFSGLSKQTANSAIRKLEQEGILYLQPADGKNKLVCLTEAGKELAQRTVGQVLTMEDDIFAAWLREDVQRYFALAAAFLLDLQKKADALPDAPPAVSSENTSNQYMHL